jgi:hypothetical protein
MVRFVLRIGLGYDYSAIMKLLDLLNVRLDVKNSLHALRSTLTWHECVLVEIMMRYD